MTAMVFEMMRRGVSAGALIAAHEALDRGELVAFSTETVYGVAARADRERGVNRLRALTGRVSGSFAVHVASAGDAARFVGVEGLAGHGGVNRFLRKAMPGPYTVVMAAGEAVVQRERARGVALDAVFEAGEAALRCPADEVARRLLAGAAGAVIASGVSLRQGRLATDAAEVAEALGDRVAMVLDGGRSRFGKRSTRVRLSAGADGSAVSTVLAEGVYDARVVDKLKRFNLLLVCTGNTCRSPMAEVIAQSIVAEELGDASVTVTSAGVYAAPGDPASAEAVTAMSALGLDLSKHRSRPLTRALLNEADVVLTMTESHRQAVLAVAPELSAKVQRLLPDADVDDPIGGPLEAYKRTAERIRVGLSQRLKDALS